MTNEEKARELAISYSRDIDDNGIEIYSVAVECALQEMAEWKDGNPSTETVKAILKADDEILYKCTLDDPECDFKSNEEYYESVAKRAAEILNQNQ